MLNKLKIRLILSHVSSYPYGQDFTAKSLQELSRQAQTTRGISSDHKVRSEQDVKICLFIGMLWYYTRMPSLASYFIVSTRAPPGGHTWQSLRRCLRLSEICSGRWFAQCSHLTWDQQCLPGSLGEKYLCLKYNFNIS